ncbi:sugar transferase [Salinicoccus sesuvii]|uniref:Sugar transferase n=1 Tax=Salinicoccus sesuvii TaxID=868281 RepID=A0ABV7N684_9STAP
MYIKVGKRLFDFIFALILLPLWLPLLLILSPIIYLSDKGPIFYNSNRLGKNGKVFKMYKFRSMRINAPDIRNPDGSTFNSERDSRLTQTGNFLRKSSLDETPQLLNVLKGDMSFIGPRPDLPEQYALYSEEEKEKLLTRPGVTGYNQAYFRNTIPWKERIKNDVYYVKNITFIFDVMIIIKTISSVLGKKNVYTVQNKDKAISTDLE